MKEIIFLNKLDLKEKNSYSLDFDNCNNEALNKIIKSKQNSWLQQLDLWHYNISKKALKLSKLWNFNSASRNTIWYPKNIKELFFSLSIFEFIKKNNYKIYYILNANSEIREYFKEFAKENNNILIKNKQNISIFLKIREKFLLFFLYTKSILYFFKDFYILLKLIIFFKNKKLVFNKKTNKIIFSYLLNFNDNFNDHFFGNNILKKSSHYSDYLFFYHIKDFNFFKKIIKMRVKNQCITFTHNWLNLYDLFLIFFKCIFYHLIFFKIYFGKNNLLIGNRNIKAFSKYFFRNTFLMSKIIDEFSIYYAFKRIFEHKKFSSIMYPFEQKGIEKSILKTITHFNSKCISIGYAHANYNIGHRYLNYINNFKNIYPNILATTGNYASKWLCDYWNWPKSKVIHIGTHRNHENIINKNIATKKSLKTNLKIVFVVGYGYELKNLALWVKQFPNLFDNIELGIRLYPYGWIEEQNEAISLLKKSGIKLNLKNKNLDEFFSWSNIILYCTTSAGIEGMFYKRLAIYCQLNNYYYINPIDEKLGSNKLIRCHKPIELSLIIKKYRENPSFFKETFLNQVNFAKNIFSNLDTKKLDNLYTKN